MPLTPQQKQYLIASAQGGIIFFLLSLPQTYMYTARMFHTLPGSVAAAGLHAFVYVIVTFLFMAYVKK